MARPLRLELAGGLYHVTSRGDGREDIYLDDTAAFDAMSRAHNPYGDGKAAARIRELLHTQASR